MLSAPVFIQLPERAARAASSPLARAIVPQWGGTDLRGGLGKSVHKFSNDSANRLCLVGIGGGMFLPMEFIPIHEVQL